MKILIAEDDPLSSRIMQKLLSPHGNCEVAANGLEAMEAFHKAYADKRAYDLICLDIMMPRMDGLEVLYQIRQLEGKRGIDDQNRVKIIMTTALSDRKNVMRAVLGRCEAYLVKPIGKETLLEKLESLGLLPNKAESD